MKGVSFEKTEAGSICFTVEEISEQLKNVIRERLSEICHGAAKASGTTILYSYQTTLKEFFNRFDAKPLNTQIGMIGELLTHVLFLHYEKEFYSASPFFNMEESSIKKGFDLVLQHKGTSHIWFVEVKAGECGSDKSIDKLGSLLSSAKSDLKTKLNDKRYTLWQNAINGANLAMKDSSLKSQINKLLEICNENALEGKSASTDYNAILSAVCFSGTQFFATGKEFKVKHDYQKGLNEFRDLMSIALQKNTIQGVTGFLRSEIQDA